MLFIIMLLVSVMPVFADEGSEVPPITLNVKAGELSSLIPESKKYKITNLKLIGELNIDDILFIREMGACRNYLNEGCLQHLDISDVTFVGHGSCWEYSEYGDLLSYVDLKTNEHIFYGSQSLQTIKLPRTLKYLGKGFLAECDNLVSVTLPSALNDFDPTAFDDCGKLTSIMIDAKNPYFHSDDSVLFNKDCTELVFAAKLTDYVIPNSVVRIRSSAFSNCSGLTSVTFPSGLTEIGSGAFKGCSGLTSLTFPSGLTEIGSGAFEDCSGLTSLTLPPGLTTIAGSAFRYSSGLTSVTFPSGLTRIEGYAFSGCSGLTSLTFPSGLTEIGNGAFEDCSGLTSLTFPSGLTTIEDSVCCGCSGLTSLTFPSGLTTIEASAFKYCSGLTSVTFPPSLTRIKDSAFSNCSGLTSVTFPSGLTEIGSLAFSGCSGLTSLAFPSSLTTIGQGAFFNASNIKSIYSYASFPPKLGVDVFNDKVQQTSILYVPKDSYQDYWFSDTWGNFENIKTFDASAVEPVFTADDASETSRYTVGGQKQGNPVKGLNIIKMSDGSVKKIMVQ